MQEDEERKLVDTYSVGGDLSLLSVEEIAEVVCLLNAEILRLEAAKLEKEKHMSAAEALFRT